MRNRGEDKRKGTGGYRGASKERTKAKKTKLRRRNEWNYGKSEPGEVQKARKRKWSTGGFERRWWTTGMRLNLWRREQEGVVRERRKKKNRGLDKEDPRKNEGMRQGEEMRQGERG